MYRVAAPTGVHGVAALPPTLSPHCYAGHASLALLRVLVFVVRACVAQTALIPRNHKPMLCPVMLSLYIGVAACALPCCARNIS